MSEAPDTSPTPAVGEPLPRGAEAFGVRYKLEMYSLDVTHKHGGPKARGFELILGITIDAIDYLEGVIQTGVLLSPVTEVRENPPWGIKCAVIVPTYRRSASGLGEKSGRVIDVTTAWQFDEPYVPPRLVSAYPPTRSLRMEEPWPHASSRRPHRHATGTQAVVIHAEREMTVSKHLLRPVDQSRS